MDVTLALAADYANITADGKLNILGVCTDAPSERVPRSPLQPHRVGYDAGTAHSPDARSAAARASTSLVASTSSS